MLPSSKPVCSSLQVREEFDLEPQMSTRLVLYIKPQLRFKESHPGKKDLQRGHKQDVFGLTQALETWQLNHFVAWLLCCWPWRLWCTGLVEGRATPHGAPKLCGGGAFVPPGGFVEAQGANW